LTFNEVTDKNKLAPFYGSPCILSDENGKQAATLRGSRPGVQSASLIMTSLMTS